MKETNIGKYVIVRGDRSGVFAGILADYEVADVCYNPDKENEVIIL